MLVVQALALDQSVYGGGEGGRGASPVNGLRAGLTS